MENYLKKTSKWLFLCVVIGMITVGIIYYFYKSETASWKTYRNDEYGFEFKHPSAWTVLKGNDILHDRVFYICSEKFAGSCGPMGDKAIADFTITVGYSYEEMKVGSSLEQYIEKFGLSDVNIAKTTTVGGKQAVITVPDNIISGQRSIEHLWVDAGKTVFIISPGLGKLKNDFSFSEEEEISQILSTFKFTK